MGRRGDFGDVWKGLGSCLPLALPLHFDTLIRTEPSESSKLRSNHCTVMRRSSNVLQGPQLTGVHALELILTTSHGVI